MKTTSASKRVYTRKPIVFYPIPKLSDEEVDRLAELCRRQAPTPILLYDGTSQGRQFCDDQKSQVRRERYINGGQVLHTFYMKSESRAYESDCNQCLK